MPLQHPTTHADRSEPSPSDAPDPERALELLADACSRAILDAARGDARSARALAEECDVSRVTAYRRLDALESAGLVDTEARYDADGHHCTVYRARPVTVTVDVAAGDPSIAVTAERASAGDRRPADAPSDAP